MNRCLKCGHEFHGDVCDNCGWKYKDAEQGDDRMATALRRYNEKQYKEAFTMFEELAEEGNPEAMYFLGECYSKGLGCYEDYEKAAEWYLKAKELGNEKAIAAVNNFKAIKVCWYCGHRCGGFVCNICGSKITKR